MLGHFSGTLIKGSILLFLLGFGYLVFIKANREEKSVKKREKEREINTVSFSKHHQNKSNTYSPWRRRRLPRSVSRNTASLDFETSCRDSRRIFACSPWSLTPRRYARTRPGQRMGLS